MEVWVLTLMVKPLLKDKSPTYGFNSLYWTLPLMATRATAYDYPFSKSILKDRGS